MVLAAWLAADLGHAMAASRRRIKAVPLAVVALALAALLLSCGSPKGSGATDAAKGRACGFESGLVSVGERLPSDCTFELLGGGRVVTLKEFRGEKPMVLNFWASWCVYCIDEMPDFQRVYAALDGRVAFLGLDLLSIQGETKPAATALARKTGVRYPLGYDEGGIIYGHFAPRLLMPLTVLVRSNGILAHRQFGPLDAARLRELIRIHLGVEV
jgi:thiol-disulfide isomerase/thioredoxin